jgi:carbamoyltransferase
LSEWLLGLGGSDHDFSAALMHGSDIRVAIEQERLSRRKHGFSHWYENPLQQAIDYCLSAEGIKISDVSMIVSSDLLPSRMKDYLRDYNLREFSHHLCHAASAYMMLPYGKSAGAIVYDGYGSIHGNVSGNQLQNLRETFSFFLFNANQYECVGRTCGFGYVERDDFPTSVTNSIGMLYELMTSLLGYDLMDCGKTMGLASHGVPRYLDDLENFVVYGENTSDCFRCPINRPELVSTIEEILLTGRGGFAVKADLAASLQTIMNKTL